MPDLPDPSEVPQLPPEIAAVLERRFTYTSADETVRATAKGDLMLDTVDVQVFDEPNLDSLSEVVSEVCRLALDEARETTTAEVLNSDLMDDELEAAVLGEVPQGDGPVRTQPFTASSDSATAVVGTDGYLLRVHIDDASNPERLGPDIVIAVNAALRAANSVEDDEDLEKQADARLAELEASLDRLTASLDPFERRLDEISKSLD